MRVGLLLCDHVDEPWQEAYGDYPAMFRALLPKVEWEVFALCDGHFPPSANHCDLWLATGSRRSVYEEEDWIVRLKALVQDIYGAGKKYIGVCFGHQMLAAAMGGEVRKAAQGWVIGIHTFELLQEEIWMQPFQQELKVLMMCQDQVWRLPPGAQLLGRSPQCPIGFFQMDHQMLGIQGHPEFSRAYNRHLMNSRMDRMGAELVEKGLQSLEEDLDHALIAQWILAFMKRPN
ncbi:MAG: amidotransferase [Bacteroidota bacterium]